MQRQNAFVVERLLAAGAILVGKTNLDQFAAGLVGVRSPYGVPGNTFDPQYVPGGSSSGSAVAVAAGLVSFSLGTDTAGSGRVPAAFNNLAGLKPSRGLLGTRGVVPACRSLDCVSIFALSAANAAQVLHAARGFDARDPFSRPAAPPARAMPRSFAGCRVGVPREDQLEFFGNRETPRLFDSFLRKVKQLGAEEQRIDFAPFLETARLLYEGPWVAERYVAIREFFERAPEALHPVTRAIIGGATRHSAIDAFAAYYRLQELRRATAAVWKDIDLLVTPTAGTIYRIAEVEADPVQLNSNLGYYTNFMNLLDLAAIAVPAGFQRDGLPFGVTLAAPAFTDDALCVLGEVAQRAMVKTMGATGLPFPRAQPEQNFARQESDSRRRVRGPHVGPAAQRPARRARRAPRAQMPHRAAVPAVRSDGVRAAAAGDGARRRRRRDRRRGLGSAGRRVRQLRRRHPGAARHRHRDARGRAAGEGLSVRDPRHPGGAGHYQPGRLATVHTRGVRHERSSCQ